MKNKFLPTTYFIISLIIVCIFNFLIPTYEIIPNYYNYSGVLLIIIGIVLNIWSDQLFKKNKTTIKPFEESNKLVIKGPYVISRNPIYLGFVIIVLGLTIFFKDFLPLIIPLILFIILDNLFVKEEEKMLVNTFGKDYKNYQEKVGKWL